MIQDFDMQLAKTDVIMMATVFIIQHLLDSQVHPSYPKLFNDKWMKITVASLLGFILHGLITNKISGVVNQTLNVHNTGMKNAIFDIVKFGTVFIVAEVVSAQLIGRDMDFGVKWQMASGLRIAAYCTFDLIESSLPKVGNMQPLYNLLIKVGSGELLAHLVSDGTLSNNNLYSTISLLTGFAVYDLIVKQMVSNDDLKISMTTIPNLLTAMVTPSA